MRQRKTDLTRASAAVVLSLALLAGCAKPAPLAPARPGPELGATPVPFSPVTPTTPAAPSVQAPTPPPSEPTEIRGRIRGIEPPMPVAAPSAAEAPPASAVRCRGHGRGSRGGRSEAASALAPTGPPGAWAPRS